MGTINYWYINFLLMMGMSNLARPIIEDDNYLIMRDYWERLAPKAAQHAAGVINLFFREVERLKDDPDFQPKERVTLMGQIRTLFKQWFPDWENTNKVGGGLAQVAEVVLDERDGEPAPISAPKPSLQPAPVINRANTNAPPPTGAVPKITAQPKPAQFLPDGSQLMATAPLPLPPAVTDGECRRSQSGVMSEAACSYVSQNIVTR